MALNEEGSDTLIIDREASYHRPRFSEEIEQAPKIAIFGSPSAAGLVGSVIRTLTLSDGHFVNNISDLHFTQPAVIWLLDGSMTATRPWSDRFAPSIQLACSY